MKLVDVVRDFSARHFHQQIMAWLCQKFRTVLVNDSAEGSRALVCDHEDRGAEDTLGIRAGTVDGRKLSRGFFWKFRCKCLNRNCCVQRLANLFGGVELR